MSTSTPWDSWKLSTLGLGMLMKLEGCVLDAEPDIAGYGTVGYGHKLLKGDPHKITQAEALNLLKHDVADVMNCLRRLFDRQPTQPKTDALGILVFNIGCSAFRGSHLYRSMLDGREDNLRVEWLSWHFVHDKPSHGLMARRQAEWKLYSTGDYS